MTLKFRDVDGKFIGKVVTTWKLYVDIQELASADGKFTYTLDEASEDYFVVMNTFGVPGTPGEVVAGPYGVFASTDADHPGKVGLGGQIMILNGSSWSEISSGISENVGIFIGVGSSS